MPARPDRQLRIRRTLLPQKRPGSRTLLNRREKNRLQKSSSPHRWQSEPLAESLDPQALTDATVAASFGADDISETDGKTELTLTVYDYDIYDMVDIAQLAVGDTIVVDGKDMVVTSREDENGFVTINGGLEQGGVDLTSDDSGVYYAVGLDDTKSYHELGKITVPVADGFVLTDNADPEHPDETYAAADLAELAASEPGFTANNTLATIEHGELTVLARSYTP